MAKFSAKKQESKPTPKPSSGMRLEHRNRVSIKNAELIDYESPFVLFDCKGRKFRFESSKEAMERTGLTFTEFTLMVAEGRTMHGWNGMQE